MQAQKQRELQQLHEVQAARVRSDLERKYAVRYHRVSAAGVAALSEPECYIACNAVLNWLDSAFCAAQHLMVVVSLSALCAVLSQLDMHLLVSSCEQVRFFERVKVERAIQRLQAQQNCGTAVDPTVQRQLDKLRDNLMVSP